MSETPFVFTDREDVGLYLAAEKDQRSMYQLDQKAYRQCEGLTKEEASNPAHIPSPPDDSGGC